MLKLSIITINYNNATGLRKTIESVVSQTSDDFEYIVIDGGSTDGSIDVIKEFENKITYWVSEPDHGIYHAMNKGIQAAKGDYCQFLNSGDWLVTSVVIEKMLIAMPECSIFYGNMLKLLPKGKIFRDICGQGNISMYTFYRGSLNHSPAFIKRSLFEKYGMYDETLKIVSDWKWYLKVIGLYNEPVKYVNLDVTCFNMNGISNTNSELENKERRRVLQEKLPASVLSDYDAYRRDIDIAIRINKYWFSRWIIRSVDRMLFKLERWKIL